MVHKKWWFWVLMALATIVTIAILGSFGDDFGPTSTGEDASQITQSQGSTQNQKEEINYEKIDLQKMLDDLDANALNAEKTYQDKYVEVIGRIKNFDSDGSYISIESVNADAWNFKRVMCDIKNDEQLEFLMGKTVEETVTIKGKIVSIGEVLGYTIEIAEVS